MDTGDARERLRRFARELDAGGLDPARGVELDAAVTQLEALLRPAAMVLPSEPFGSAGGYLLTDRAGVILEANRAAADLLGVSEKFLLDKPFPLFLVQAHWPALYALLGRSGQVPGVVRDWPVRLRPIRGEPVAVSLTMSPAQNADHRVRLRWLLRHPGRGPEVALEIERALADTLLDAAEAVALVLDDRGQILSCNPYACAASGHDGRDLISREWVTALIVPEGRPAAREAGSRASVQNISGNFTAGLLTRSGPPRTVVWSLRPLHRPEGRGSLVLALGHDITELKQAQERALQAERLAAIGQVTAALAHESRNLLQSALACLERLAWRSEGQPEAADLIARARAAHQGLALLFDDVRSYAAPLRLELAQCALPPLWRQVWGEVRAAFPNREANLREAGDAPECRIDRFRMGQVFRNLFENSFAACPAGEPVRVDIGSAAFSREGRSGVRVSVRDHGSGIGPEQRARVFDPFFTTKSDGTGLGMTIARRIVEAHAGEVAIGDVAPGFEIILWLPRYPS